jgi:hypothetical protein
MISRRTLLASALAAPGADLRFHAMGDGGFRFDTGVLKGELRKEGKATGLLPAVHGPSGTVLATSMGLFGVYRVFSDGRRYGNGMWYVESEAQLAGDGSVAVRWAAAEDRPFGMEAVYRWVEAGVLDIVISVTPERDLRGFETFLACYFGPGFTQAQGWVRGGRLVTASRTAGDWQMFPRDAAAAAMIRDGRWKILPHPVDWAIREEFEGPVGVRRNREAGLTAVVLSRRRDCFAVSMPHETDTHFSTYLSLFGRVLRAGETARAGARLVLVAGEADVGRLYRDYEAG